MNGVGGVGFGLPELTIVLVLFFVWAIPFVAGIWALFTLYRMRVDQQAMRRTVENIEQLLQRR
jgi:hypothetical protein